jgi:hypothetical protein
MSRFAQTDDEADNRYKEFKLKDPFPDIPHTLLNFVEIKKYVEETGMIHPFHPEENKLKYWVDVFTGMKKGENRIELSMQRTNFL